MISSDVLTDCVASIFPAPAICSSCFFFPKLKFDEMNAMQMTLLSDWVPDHAGFLPDGTSWLLALNKVITVRSLISLLPAVAKTLPCKGNNLFCDGMRRFRKKLET
jgi:hypothetical protein